MYKRIMVALDSSSTAAKALDEAIALAKALGAKLAVAHAADEGHLAQHGMGLGTYLDIEKIKGEIHASGQALVGAALDRARAAGCEAEPILIESTRRRVAEMLAEAAQNWNADLIVAGTHGKRGFERMLVGSVTENLTRMAGTSLLLVREQV